MRNIIFLLFKKIVLFFLTGLFPALAIAGPVIKTTAPGGDFTTGYQGGNVNFNANDQIVGHVMFKNGFKLSTLNRTVIWDADGIVNGPVRIGAANNSSMTLQLSSDLRLGSTARFLGYASNNLVKINSLNSTIYLNGNMTLYNCIAPLLVSGATTGNLTIDGQGYQLTLTSTRSQQIQSAFDSNLNAGMSLTLRNMRLVFDSNNANVPNLFRGNGDANSHLTLENVAIYSIPYANPVGIFNSGSSKLIIRGDVSFDSPGGVIGLAGGGTPSIVIERNSTLRVGRDTIFALARSGSIGSFTMDDRTSVLYLDGCDFYTSAAGSSLQQFNLYGGTVLFGNKVRIFNTYYGGVVGADMSTAFTFGDGINASNDVDARVLGGAYVTLAGAINYNHS